ncbi:hypothetical protein ACHABQ_00885 [Nesterenkonia aurantiaca]|uniref:hypothetical protein n=1 Tax=Nesterenkonia aurantiaca TaxID=1436010 RepID=UPI003EE45B56
MTRPGPLDVVDVFVYTVVLGLFVQFFPQVISESFAMTLLTAVLLKLVLELVTWAKKSLIARLRARRGVRRGLNGVVLVLVLPGSKFVVLELTALIFRGEVQLGGFFLVTALIIVLMLARGGTRRLFHPRPASVSPD